MGVNLNNNGLKNHKTVKKKKTVKNGFKKRSTTVKNGQYGQKRSKTVLKKGQQQSKTVNTVKNGEKR